MCVLGVFPAIIEILLIAFILPESPRWLISVGRSEEAFSVLKRIRMNEANAEKELKEIQNLSKIGGVEEKGQSEGAILAIYLFGTIFFHYSLGSGILSMLSEHWFLHCLLIGIGIGLCQASAAGGIIMYYGTLVLRDNNGNNTAVALLGNTANGVGQTSFISIPSLPF
jgi:major inositol transporter-like SP family MFS transporter